MSLLYFDAHTHFEEYGDEAPSVAEAMREMGIGACAVSVRLRDYDSLLQLAAINPFIIPAAGIHPMYITEETENVSLLEKTWKACSVIGEIGLDKKWSDPKTFSAQLKLFDRQLDIACRYHKPVNLHTSGADAEVLRFLRIYRPSGVLIHWFDGPADVLHQYLDLGCYVSVASDVNSSRRKRRLCRSIPEDRLLCETDGPKAIAWGLKRPPCTEDYNPDSIIRIYRAAATVREVPVWRQEAFFSRITQNAVDLLMK